MDLDFGYSSNQTDNSVKNTNDLNNNNVTDINTGKIDSDKDGVGIDDIDVNDDNNIDSSKNNDSDIDDSNKNDNTDKKYNNLEVGTSIEVGDNVYTVDENGNLIDENGNMFKQSDDVENWIKEFDKIEDANDININNIQEALGVQITDDDDNPIEFENTISGIKAYVDAVIETAKDEHYEAAINTLYQRYPILNDVLNYYLANGNSLEGFNELPDRSNITIDDTNEAQQELIIRTAWNEQNRKGDVEGYIQYLKSSGTLLATAKEELAGLQEADALYKQEIEQEAERKENERIQKLENYWNGVHDVIKTRNIAGYQIPETIIINRDGQKISATPEDFFNYIYRVDNNGMSAYERALAAETPESRRDDEILRAYLKFVGGNYSNLVNMAINKEKVAKLRLKSKERNSSTIRINKPQNTNNKNTNIDFGYN